MRILFVTQWFQPETFSKGVPFIRKLMQRGHQAEVLTGFPNYPAGKLYDGYKVRFYQKETIEGIPVHRVPLYPSHDKSGLRRIVNYSSYAMSASIIGPWVLGKADLIYVYHPPPTTYIPAFLFKLLKRIPVVLDIQDFFPDTLAATGMFNNKLGLHLVDAYCRFFYRAADKIVVLSPGFRRKLMDKRVPEGKIEVIYNWCDDSQIVARPPTESLLEELSFRNKFNILFAGNMGKAQKLETVLEAARILQSQNENILFTFMGGGIEVDTLKETVSRFQLKNVQILPPRPRHEIGTILNAADILLVHLKKDPLFEITIPSKIQAYLSVGKPILVAVPGDASALVEEAGAGLSCPPEDSQGLADSVLRFVQMSKEKRLEMGCRGRDYYVKNLSLDAGTEHFERVFHETIERWKNRKTRRPRKGVKEV